MKIQRKFVKLLIPAILLFALLSANVTTVFAAGVPIWQPAAIANVTAVYPNITADGSGTLYVAFNDASNYKGVVMKNDGSGWNQVGGAFSEFNSPFNIIRIDSHGTPYVAYTEMSKINVKKYDTSSGSWVQVGASNFSPDTAQYLSFTLDDDDTPYVAFRDDSASAGGKVTVMKYGGPGWSIVGDDGFSAEKAYGTAMAADGDTVYMAYYNGGGNAYVMTYDGSGWVQVGSTITANSVGLPSIAVDSSGKLCLVNSESASGYRIRAWEYDSGSSDWAAVGNLPTEAGTAYNPVMAIDSADTPYVVYMNSSYQLCVRKYDDSGSKWDLVGNAGFSKDSVNYPGLAFDGDDKPYVVYQDHGSSYSENYPIVCSLVTGYYLNYTAGAHGSISGAATQAVAEGSAGEAVTAAPQAGYHFVKWSDDSTANPRTDTNVMSDLNITADFAINTYTLEYEAGANGTLTGNASQTVNHGGDGTTVTAVPNPNYHFHSWSDGSTSNPRTDTGVAGSVNATAYFALDTFTLEYGVGANGTVSGSALQTVNYGENGTAVEAQPDTGYHFTKWSDNTTANPRTDTGITDNVSVSAIFAVNTYTLEYTAATHGSIMGTLSQTVNHGGTGTAVIAVPDANYHFAGWSDGVATAARTETNVTAAVHATANFAANFSVAFDSQGGSPVAGLSNITPGAIISAPTAPTKTGFVFGGWFKDAACTDDWVFASDVVNSNLTLYAKWTAETGSGGPSGGSTPSTEKTSIDTRDNTTTSTTTITASVGSDGTAKASVTQAQITEAVRDTAQEAAKKGTKAEIEIKVDADKAASGVSVTIPKSAFQAISGNGIDALTISSQTVAITFDDAALAGINTKAGGDVVIKAALAESDALSEVEKATIGGRPVYDLTVTGGGKAISEFEGKAAVSIPYSLRTGEDSDSIVIYYKGANGDLVMVPNCVYNPETGSVTFMTEHFSTYAVGYHDVSFSDVSGWYGDFVHYLAAREIMSGAGNGLFNPDSSITRSQFATILANLAGADLTGYQTSSFEDVSEKSWYFPAVQWAYENGIVTGSGGSFRPEASISRQEIAVMITRYTDNSAGFELIKSDSPVTFSDSAQIAEYATQAVSDLQQAGIISGSNGSFDPAATATRAQAAKMITVLHQQMIVQ